LAKWVVGSGWRVVLVKEIRGEERRGWKGEEKGGEAGRRWNGKGSEATA
jgi:hypothetical protein